MEMDVDLFYFRNLWRDIKVIQCLSSSLLLYFYISSFIFFSCLFIPDAVGVGSSGALMGLLGSWVVFIIIRW